MANYTLEQSLKSLLEDGDWQNKELSFQKLVGEVDKLFH